MSSGRQVERRDSHLLVRCNRSSSTSVISYLTCIDNQWIGVLENCSIANTGSLSLTTTPTSAGTNTGTSSRGKHRQMRTDDKQADPQTDRHTDREADRQRGRQTETDRT